MISMIHSELKYRDAFSITLSSFAAFKHKEKQFIAIGIR